MLPPDLRVTQLYATARSDGTYNLVIVIRNDGASRSAATTVTYGVSSSNVPSWTYEIGSLAPGEQWVVTDRWIPIRSTSHQLFAQVDPANTVYESNEGNNYWSVWYYR